MQIAKIIRHRHKRTHYINDDLKSIQEEVHYKLLFSDPGEMKLFMKWCKKHNGTYDFDKAHGYGMGKMPRVKFFKEQYCWCDLMTYYLLHVADYSFHSSIEPYKGEVYVKG
jgi:hypothetical protein